MSKLSAVIIDDEFFNRKLISMLITKINPDFAIEGEAENVRDGFKIINAVKPAVVFLDVKMPDGSGFDLLRRFSTINFEVVFITGFDQYALQAFDFNALDYVLKPIDLDKFEMMLKKVVQRLITKSAPPQPLKEIAEFYASEEINVKKIPLHYENKVILLPIDELMYLLSDNESTIFTTINSETYVSKKNISEFEFILAGFPNYLQVNQQAYVNVNFVSSYSKGKISFVIMRDEKKILITDNKKTKMLDALEQKKR